MGTSEIAYPGKVLASIQLFGSSGERLTTARFQFEVVADLITSGAVQSESRFPILQQLVADVEQLKQDIVNLQIPNGSIMDVKLSDAAGQIKQRFATHMADYASAHGGTYHKNLLHNWDFRNPVNQRGLTSYVSDSTTGFYTIDRWMLNWNNDKVDIDSVNGNISITTVAGGRQFYQIIEKLKAGTYTFSADVISATNDWRLRYGDTTKPFITPETTGIVSVQFTISNDYENYRIGLQSVTAGSITLKCVKLELGDTSTLANDPPADYGEQLALCKRFYRLWTTEAARTEALKEVGLMRIPNPTLGTIDIGGTTYYYASADL